jgi:hypothetical protein
MQSDSPLWRDSPRTVSRRSLESRERLGESPHSQEAIECMKFTVYKLSKALPHAYVPPPIRLDEVAGEFEVWRP